MLATSRTISNHAVLFISGFHSLLSCTHSCSPFFHQQTHNTVTYNVRSGERNRLQQYHTLRSFSDNARTRVFSFLVRSRIVSFFAIPHHTLSKNTLLNANSLRFTTLCRNNLHKNFLHFLLLETCHALIIQSVVIYPSGHTSLSPV